MNLIQTLEEWKAQAEAALSLDNEDWPISEAALKETATRFPKLCEAFIKTLKEFKFFLQADGIDSYGEFEARLAEIVKEE